MSPLWGQINTTFLEGGFFINSITSENTYISFVGMSGSEDNTREDHVIYATPSDPTLFAWIENYATSNSAGTNESDFWASGYQTILERIIDSNIPNPTIVICLGDEGVQPWHIQDDTTTVDRAIQVMEKSKLFAYVVDSDGNSSLSGTAPFAFPEDVIPSIDGETDLADSDYYVTENFNSLKDKIQKLNDSLINSDIICTQKK